MLVVRRPTIQNLLQSQNTKTSIQTAQKFKRLNWKQSEKYFKKVAKSKTYQDLCKKEDASRYGRLDPQLELAHFRGAPLVKATWYGTMRLQETNCPYTIIHEFAHLCGNMHHDIGFRRDVIKLSSRFFGVEFAKMLKGQFKKNKLKVTVSQHIMTPEKWIESVMRMEKIREGIYMMKIYLDMDGVLCRLLWRSGKTL